jgi:1-acyl-sn-glycerol-3-phosphate acyltransferase
MRPWYRFCRMMSHAVFLLVFRGRVLHTARVPRKGGVLLVCNHQSYLDPVLAALALPREAHFMARDTLFRGGFFKPLIESLNAFPVKRGSADIGAIKETLKRLKNGGLITVFPEATRTEDGTIRPMQPGVVLVARKAGVPLVPTLILGAFEAWPRHAKLPRPRRVLVAYGEPLTPAEMKELSDEQCVALVRGRIVELMERYRSHPHVAGRLKPLPGQAGGNVGR